MCPVRCGTVSGWRQLLSCLVATLPSVTVRRMSSEPDPRVYTLALLCRKGCVPCAGDSLGGDRLKMEQAQQRGSNNKRGDLGVPRHCEEGSGGCRVKGGKPLQAEAVVRGSSVEGTAWSPPS